MASFIVLAAMKGRFVSDQGHTYDNFSDAGVCGTRENPNDAVATFFDQAPFPIRWGDVEYMWAERLADHPSNTHYGDYERVYVDSLRRRWEPMSKP